MPVEVLVLPPPETIFSTRLVVSRTTPDKSVRSGMCEENLLYMLLGSLPALLGLRDSTYFSCCFRKMAFLSSSCVLVKDSRVSLKDLMALERIEIVLKNEPTE